MIRTVLAAVVLLLVTATPGLAAHWHGSVFFGVGPYWWGPPYPYWAYSPYYPYYPPPTYVYPPPPVIGQEPTVYIQQPPAQAPPPPPDGPYWYYCPSARAYFPTVSQCPEAWVKVPPRPE